MYIPHCFICHVEYFEEIKPLRENRKIEEKLYRFQRCVVLCFKVTDKCLNLNSKLHFIVS